MAVRHGRIPVRVGSTARSNPFLGIALTKAQKHAKSTGKKALFRTKYMRCKQSKANKGKAVFPEEGGKKCKGQYNKWQKHRGKAGERALKLSEKLNKKGKLDPELSELLQQDILDSASEEYEEAEILSEGGYLDEDVITEGALGLDEGSDNTMLYVAAGGIVAAGLVGFLLLRK